MLCLTCGKIPFLCTCKPGVLRAPPSRTPMVGSSAPAPAKKAPKDPPPKRKHNEIGTRPSQDEEEEEDTLALASGSSTSSVLTPPRVPLSPPSTGAVNKKEPPQKKSRLLSPSTVPLPLVRPTCSRCGSTGLEGVRTCTCKQHRMCESCMGEADGPWHATQCETCGSLCTALCNMNSQDISCPGCLLFVRSLAQHTRPLPMNDGTGRVGFPTFSGMLLPFQECGRNTVTLPRFQVGWLAEALFTHHVQSAGVELLDVKPAGDQGIDLIAYASTHELRQALETRLGLKVHSSERPKRGVALLPTLFFFEVKANDADLSDDQKDFTAFVRSRLKTVIGSKGQTERAKEARKAAQRCLNLLGDAKKCNVAAYIIRIEFPEHHEAGPIVLKTYPWVVSSDKVNRTVQGTVTLARTNDLFVIDGWHGQLRHEYITSKYIGDLGEARARTFLSALGFTDIRSMQNNIGNGIDLLAYHPDTLRWCFFEIKSHWSEKAGLAYLRDEQRCEWQYTRKKTMEVILGMGNFGHSQVDFYTQLLAGIVYAELGGDDPSKSYSIEKHFVIDVFLPASGTPGVPRITMRRWDKKADLAESYTHEQIVEHREERRLERYDQLPHDVRFARPTPNDPFGTCPQSEYDPVMDIWAPPSPQEARRIQALHDTHHAQWLLEQQAARNRWIQEARQNQSTQQ